ncbi:P-loop containing nucleoside triphosphate hydrolase protein [Mycena sanguinolenta]|nr:P-loop containing nucleoside triphosphate hydrolase protein [Mycena sanguinolenta]
MSSTRSLDASTSQPAQKGGGARWKPFKWRPFKSRSLNHGNSIPQTVVNQYISASGGQGGRGGQGGVHGGGGGHGEGPNFYIETEHLIMNMGQSPNVVGASPQVMNNCPPASRNFHGQRTILDTMHHFFAQDMQKQKIYVLYGLGGAGKTQIALKFIEESTCFADQLLLDASTTDTIHTGLRNIITAGTASQDALAWLAGKHENWLLFLDNADDPEINLNQFFPRCNHGNIIITSRNPNLRVYGGNSQVTDMEESDAVALLLKSSQQDMSAANQLLAQDIVKALWYFPLAIVQAGAFISEAGTLETYLDLFLKNRTELLKKQSSQRHDAYAWAVYTAWEMSFSKLSPIAVMFLQLCSFIHWDAISEDIFSRAASRVMQLPQIATSRKFLSHFVGATGKWDSLSFLKVTNEIKAYSLLNFNAERKAFSIHPLVHSWTRTTLDQAESYHRCMDEVLGNSILEIPDHDMLLASLRLVSHVDSLIKDFPINYGWQYGTLYRYARRYADAKELQIIEVENQRKLYGPDGLDTLRAMNNLANTYHRLGQFEEAEKLQVEVLEKRRRLLGEDDLDTVIAMRNLAATYPRLGRFEDAEKLEVIVLEKQRKLLGDDHPDTLDAMRNLAITYHKLEQFEEAAKLYIAVVEKWKQLAGDDHPKTLAAMHGLANTYDALGHFEEVEKLEVVVLEKRRKIFGEDHLETLSAMNNLGCTYGRVGKLVEAEALQVVVLEKRRELLGDHHADTQLAMQNLIITYHGLGKQAEAAELKRLLEHEVEDSMEEDGDSDSGI